MKKIINHIKRMRTYAYRGGIDNWLFSWLQAWAALLDGIIGIVSLGLLCGGLEMTVCAFRTKYALKKQQKINRRKDLTS